MQNLRLQVFKQTASNYQLQLFENGQSLPKTRAITATELQTFLQQSHEHYDKNLRLQDLGLKLFNWLNGQEGWLQKYAKDCVLHIATTEDLHSLAWELLHNGQYLCANQHQPFTPQRLIADNQLTVKPANRPLRLLFMASSPEKVNPVLAFEREEAMILAATRHSNLELIVEESGSLEGLAERVSYGENEDCFDVVHITGHADIQDGKPVFVLENEFGQADFADADQIAAVFSTYGRYPRLLFLSGCKTAQSSESALPSLAESLVKAGVSAVLGWAKPVYDSVASFTAQTLYKLLADGVDLVRAVALTRQALWADEQKKLADNPTYQAQWHYLRFYSDLTLSSALVIKGRSKPRREIRQAFLDKQAKIEVCAREDFVGRRRLLQQTLRWLRTQQGDSDYAEGVQLLGMGGLGKSSLALRLCQRLEIHLPQRFIWVGKVDETALRTVLSNELPQHAAELNAVLNQSQALELRLIQLFNQLESLHSALFVFDDFEQNFTDETYQHLQPDAYTVVKALASAIHQTGSPSRVLLTSRGQIHLDKPLQLAALNLDSFRDADLDKKLATLRLAHLSALTVAERRALQPLEQQAIALGAGNPRLLERLYHVLANRALPHEQILQSLAAKQAEFREELLLKTLLSFQNEDTRRLIATLALFEIFMPVQVLQAVFEKAKLDSCLQAAMAVGLIETHQERFFVSRLLLPLVAGELDEEQQLTIYATAAGCLYKLWRDNDHKTNLEAAWELSRIAKLSEQKVILSEVISALAKYLKDVCRYDEAKPLYNLLLPILHELDNQQGIEVTLNNLAEIAHIKGDYDGASSYMEQSLEITRKQNHKQNEEAVLNNIAVTALAKGDHNDALQYINDMLKIRQDINAQGRKLNNISQILYTTTGDYDTAYAVLTASLKNSQDIGDKIAEGVALNNFGKFAFDKGDYETAFNYYSNALKIGNEVGKCVALNNIGYIYFKMGKLQQAIASWLKAYKIAKEIGLAQVLEALDSMAKQLGGAGLEFWEELSQPFEQD